MDDVDDDAFANSILKDDGKRQLPKIFNRYYEAHLMADTDLAKLERETRPATIDPLAIQTLFAENLDQKIDSIVSDIQTLSAIAAGNIDTKTFDFEGKKRNSEEANEVIQQLTKEKTQAEVTRDQRDQEAYRLFYAQALAKGPAQAAELLEKYRLLSEARSWKTACDEPVRAIYFTIHYLAQNGFNVSVELAQPFRELHTYQEPTLRAFFSEKINLDVFAPDLQEKIKTAFLGKPIAYHYENQPHQTNLENLYSLVAEINIALGELYFNRLKTVLELQAALLKG